ncbi:helix-turn-helix domain-containing protein, partial [Pseudomonas aeruginosa]
SFWRQSRVFILSFENYFEEKWAKIKSCDPILRKIIMKFVERGWSYRRIAQHLNCSKTMVCNAVQHNKRYNTDLFVSRTKISIKTTPQEDRMITRLAKKDPFLGSI